MPIQTHITKSELDALYQKTIDDQRHHLLTLQEQFNAKCEIIRKAGKEKLAKIPDENRDAKEAVLVEQKKSLEETLSWLKQEVNQSTWHTMKALEDIQRQREEFILTEIEQQIAAL